MASTSGAPPAQPSALDVQKKLSLHSKSKPKRIPPPALSGTESDSDSGAVNVMGPPDASPGVLGQPSSSSSYPLTSIAERRTGMGDETDEDDEDELDEGEGEGGWRVAGAKGKAAADAAGTESVAKAGYLSKKGVRRKTWKKRWFVLRPPHLAYYKTDAEYKLLRLLDLQDIHAVTPVSLKRHENTFGIVTQARTFYLQAENRQAVDSWVQKLNEIRERVQATSSVASANGTPGPAPGTPVSSSPIRQLAPPLTPPAARNVHSSSDSEDEPPSPGVASSPPKNASKDPGKTVLSGYLMKCGSKRKHWRKRWFVLTGEKLVYTGSHMDTKPHRQIPLAQILDALEYTAQNRHASPHIPSPQSPPTASPLMPPPGEDDQNVAGKAHTFKIITPKRTLLLCAPSEEEEIKWLSAVRALIARRAGVKEASGSGSAAPGNTASGISTSSSAGSKGVAAVDGAQVATGSAGMGHKKSGSVDKRTRAGSNSGLVAAAAGVVAALEK